MAWRRCDGVAHGSRMPVAGLTTSSTMSASKRSRIVLATTALSRMKTSSDA